MNKKILLHAMIWNSFHVIAYKIILQLHQTALFYYTNKLLFGLIGTIFSTFYFILNITNFGFDYALLTFKSQCIASKQHFKSFLIPWLIRVAQLIILAICFWLLFPKIILLQTIPPLIQKYLIFLFVSESLKKSLEFFASLLLLNKAVTFIEIAMLIIYCCTIWTGYYIFNNIYLSLIFIPLCITSFIELCFLLFQMYQLYQTLPSTSTYPKLHYPDFYTNQAINYINQITKACFSPNCIIMLLAYNFGLVKAGIIKITIDTIITLYMLVNRAVGIPSAALMSNQSTKSNIDIKNIFLLIKNDYIQFLYLSALCIVLYVILFTMYVTDQSLGLTLLLFCLTAFLEFFIITYEKLFITQNKSQELALINLISLFCLIIALQCDLCHTQSLILIPFLLVRLSAIGIIMIIAKKHWQILPSFALQKPLKLIILVLLSALLITQILY